jgi:DNA-binding Lrp family transcriptional regulator
MRKLMAVFGLIVAVGSVAPAMATTRAYVLIETAPDKAAVVRDSLGSLANCLALVAALMPAEIVAHVECNDLASLNKVVTEEIPEKDGVKRATLWLVISRQ